MNHHRHSSSIAFCSTLLMALVATSFAPPLGAFDFTEELFGDPGTLSAWVQSLDVATGEVVINGVDSAEPSIPFDVDWGDGTPVEQDFFEFQHTYGDPTANYTVQITSHYEGGGTDTTVVPVRFVAPQLVPIELPEPYRVIIDNGPLVLASRPFPGYPAPSLDFFDDSFFPVVPRSAAEYVMHLAAVLQLEITAYDVLEVSGGFQQHVLRDPGFGGMYSLWFTDPVALAAGNGAFGGSIQYSSLFHEMGHNVTLNFPAAYHYGGRIDGQANAIYSETMAQIFAHYTAYAMINNHVALGLGDVLTLEIEQSARSSMRIVRNSYDAYVDGGSPYTSWNNPGTPEDETFGTFMTLAFKFFEHAENAGDAYTPRMVLLMDFLRHFNPDLEALYAAGDDSGEAETARSTYMIAALSYAFAEDLRAEMQALNFPIDNDLFDELLQAQECQAEIGLVCPPSVDPQSYVDGLNVQINGGVGAPPPCPEVANIRWDWGDGTTSDSFFPASHTYPTFGNYTVVATAVDAGEAAIVSASCDLPMENRWTLITTDHDVSRESHDMVFDSARQRFVLYGGRVSDPLADTWEYDGRAWSQIETDHAPPARFWHAMAYDSHRNRTVLFGGGDPDHGILYDDTWEYDGIDWQQVITSHAPPPGTVKSMAFDSARHLTVLVFGDAESETWEYDGADWTLVETPESPPPPGGLAALAYDAARERTVLTFENSTPQLATWEYDGSTWEEIATENPPLGRWAHTMVYDPCRQRVVLYGGYSPYFEGGSLMEDTWEYNGTDWEQILTPVSAGQREQQAMAFDSTNCRMIMNIWEGTWIYPKPFEIFFKTNFEG